MRARATDGIVNVYLPGYVSGYFTHAAVKQVKSWWFSSRNDSIIDEDVNVRADAGASDYRRNQHWRSNAAACNAAWRRVFLRLKAAVPALLEAVRAKDNDLIFESLVALQKIHDPSAGPSVSFLVRDLDERTQITAMQTVGVLGTREAAPDVRYAIQSARSVKIRRAALSALAMLAMPEDRPHFQAIRDERRSGIARRRRSKVLGASASRKTRRRCKPVTTNRMPTGAFTWPQPLRW